MTEIAGIPRRQTAWTPTYRVVPSRFPPVGLFDRVADPADLDAVFYVEALTNDRLRQETGDISLVPPEDRIAGPGTTPIMAAFTHLNLDGTRFSDGSFGVYYAARSEATAIAESRHHRERFMRYSHEKPMDLEMRVYLSDMEGLLHDIRAPRYAGSPWYHPDDYHAGQALGRTLRLANSWGLLYNSLRHKKGQCVAVFRPPILRPVVQGRHLVYHWDGEGIGGVSVQRR